MTTRRRSSSLPRPPSRDQGRPCTHLSLTRLYDDTGREKCSICHRPPLFGWLYRCTQDYGGFLPASDVNRIDITRPLERDVHLHTLSPSISEAASKGHYTDQQLRLLWKQKSEVRRLIQQIRPSTSSSVSTASSSSYSIDEMATYSTLPSTESDTELESDFGHFADFSQHCRLPLETIHEVHDDLERDHDILPLAKSTSLPLCNFKVCHNCRPNYRDRAWLSLNGLMKDPIQWYIPPKHEVDNRRAGHIEVVKNLGTGIAASEFEYAAQGKRRRRSEFQGTVQRLLRTRDAGTVLRQEPRIASHGYTQGLSRVRSYQNLAAIAASGMDELDDVPNLSTEEPITLGINRARTPSGTETSAAASDGSSTSGFAGLRPLYYRRGLERIASIRIPLRASASLSGQSTSSQEPSTSQSISSCPGIVERPTLEDDASEVLEDVEENPEASVAQKVTAEPPQKTPTGSTHSNILGFRRTPKATTRFLID